MKQNSLTSGEKIKKADEFRKVIFSGKKIKSEFFNVYFLKNTFNFPRFGVSVAKKAGTAVVRNKLKRIARECFRLNKGKIKENHDLIFVFKTKIDRKEFGDLQSKIENCLKDHTWFQPY